MASYAQPYIIQQAELASQRASWAVRAKLGKRLTSLATVSASAALIGFWGTVVGIMNSFVSSGSRSSTLVMVASRISLAMVPGILGLLVSVMAFWFYRCLSGQMETFDLEMKNASTDMANRLVTYLGRLRSADAVLWAALTQRTRGDFSFERGPNSLNEPDFTIRRMYRNGFLELLWPRIQSKMDAQIILNLTAVICLGYGALGFYYYLFQRRMLAGVFLCFFFAVAAIGLRRGWVASVVSVWFFLAGAAFVCAVAGGWSTALWLAAATLPFVGSLCAAAFPDIPHKDNSALQVLGVFLVALLAICAVVTVSFGPILGWFALDSGDTYMQPTMQGGDVLIGLNTKFAGPVYRGDLMTIEQYGCQAVRVVGLPGDRIQIRVGKLAINGSLVPEPYIEPWEDIGGDFPLPSTAYPDGSLRWEHGNSYGSRMTENTVYVVPPGTYFFLNDNRQKLSDSRTLGPWPGAYFTSKVILDCSECQVISFLATR